MARSHSAKVRRPDRATPWRDILSRRRLSLNERSGAHHGSGVDLSMHRLLYSERRHILPRTALITGVTGQDGAYLAQLLLTKGYRVIGGYRRSSLPVTWRLDALGISRLVEMVPLDLLEYNNILDVVRTTEPDEVYNLAAQSFVGASFSQPLLTAEVNAVGALRLLEAVREAAPEARFYQASTSEMFGCPSKEPQDETTPFRPRSPYAYAKVFAHWAAVNAREAGRMHVSCGISFNHESPLRGTEFVTRKITSTLAAIRSGVATELRLGNIHAKRDWGYAEDYVVGMWNMVQQSIPGDYVLATGESHSVLEFVQCAAQALDIPLVWEHDGSTSVGLHARTGAITVRTDATLVRPTDVHALRGDAGKARTRLQWTPTVNFTQLVELMVRADRHAIRRLS